MTFIWPHMLWLLVILPVLVLLYLLLQRRKKKFALRYANLSMVKEAMGAGPTIRRHIPPALFAIALLLMILGTARPAAVLTLPSNRATVILAMDVSGSMRAGDIKPNRLVAAQRAATAFIKGQPSYVRTGVVAFSGTAFLVQAPTQSREDLVDAVDRLQLERATAIGRGLLVSLKALFPNEKIDTGEPPWLSDGRGGFGGYGRDDQSPGAPLGQNKATTNAPARKVPPGSDKSAIIILLTDGTTTAGPDPVEVARTVADHGVRVITVGFGSREGQVIGFGGRFRRVSLDEDALKRIADITRGQYFRATSAEDLSKIYKTLNTQFIVETRQTEVTAFFAGAAALFALISAFLSMWWFNRVL